MELLDYSGKLNKHEDYLKMLDKLKEKCKYIEVVKLNNSDKNELFNEYKDKITSTTKVYEWWATELFDHTPTYDLNRFDAYDNFFKFLTKYETFTKFYFYNEHNIPYRGDFGEMTNFGADDIAFYDENNISLLETNSHEGYIFIREDMQL